MASYEYLGIKADNCTRTARYNVIHSLQSPITHSELFAILAYQPSGSRISAMSLCQSFLGPRPSIIVSIRPTVRLVDLHVLLQFDPPTP